MKRRKTSFFPLLFSLFGEEKEKEEVGKEDKRFCLFENKRKVQEHSDFPKMYFGEKKLGKSRKNIEKTINNRQNSPKK